MPYSILIVEDDLTFATMLKTWLGKKGFLVDTAGNSARARKQLDAQSYNLVLSDLRLPDQDGISLLAWMKEHGHQIPLIIMTGYADIQSAVQAMKNGANDYISKPVQPDVLLKKINEALQNETVIAAPSGSAPSISIAPSSNFLEGESEAARQLYNYVGLVAPTPMSVLINGASGTGKEYVAHRIHQLSKRADKPFIAIDCGSIPKELAASEFFGHVKGSFTGALNDKTGAFVEANGGTLFLDEIGNLSYEVQIQLLRALQERRIRPVGSNKEIEVNVRLISATNENLQKAIEKGNFREDLYYRLSVFQIHLPPLRERKEDIELLAESFIQLFSKKLGKQVEGMAPEFLKALKAADWRGNIRELRNVIERSMIVCDKQLTLQDLPIEIQNARQEDYSGKNYSEFELAAMEKRHIAKVLQHTKGNKAEASRLLKIGLTTLYRKIEEYGI